MNDKGLTVTINAGKSDIPSKAATPISLLAREILQYAANIEEAIEIAKKRKTFVAESILIGSAEDNKAVIIEKSPTNLGVYEANESFLVCSNHFQSDAFSNDKANLEHKNTTATAYRQSRAEELILIIDTVNYIRVAEILRDRGGMNDESIGIGNEKTMAQMISHHSVIFQPMKKRLWVSTQPFQFGKYIGYDLEEVLTLNHGNPGIDTYDSLLTINNDPFLKTREYEDYLGFKKYTEVLRNATVTKDNIDNGLISDYLNLNKEYYLGYVVVGDYYASIKDNTQAIHYYSLSLTKEFEKVSQREKIQENINDLKNN